MVGCFSSATFSHLSAGGNRLKTELNQLWYFIQLVKWREGGWEGDRWGVGGQGGKRSRDIHPGEFVQFLEYI